MGSLRDELAELLGEAGMRRLIERRGGRRTRIPRQIPRGHWLEVYLGREAAEALAFRFGGCRIDVPKTPPPDRRDERIRELDASGWSASDIAGHVGLSERQVRRILRG